MKRLSNLYREKEEEKVKKKTYKEATISSNAPAAKQTSNISNEKAASHFCKWMRDVICGLWNTYQIDHHHRKHIQSEWNAVYLLYGVVVWKVRTDYYLGLGFDMMCVWIILFDILLRNIINVAYIGWRCHQFTNCYRFVPAVDVKWLMCSCADNMKCKLDADDCDRIHVTKLNHLLRLICTPACVNWLCGVALDAEFMCVGVRFHLNDMHP